MIIAPHMMANTKLLLSLQGQNLKAEIKHGLHPQYNFLK